MKTLLKCVKIASRYHFASYFLKKLSSLKHLKLGLQNDQILPKEVHADSQWQKHCSSNYMQVTFIVS